MKRYLLYVLPMLLPSAEGVQGADPVVENVVAGQVSGTCQVQISYDVSWPDGTELDISVVISDSDFYPKLNSKMRP